MAAYSRDSRKSLIPYGPNKQSRLVSKSGMKEDFPRKRSGWETAEGASRT